LLFLVFQYTPLFDFFAAQYKGRAFKVLTDTYVTMDTGTGIVHQAPGHGEVRGERVKEREREE
jgi:isoleucyl-tRNA synthetase